MEINYKKLYLDHHNCELESNYTGGYDFELSVEYTADSYNVYVAKYCGESIHICEHIYYYVSDLDEVLKEKIEECDKVFCDEEIEDDLYIEWRDWCELEGLIEWNDDDGVYFVAGEEE